AGPVRAGRAAPLGVLVAERRRAAAAVPGARAAESPPAGDPGRADPGPRPGRPPRRVGRGAPAAGRGHDRAAGHPRDGRSRGALRADRRDAGRPRPRRGHARRAGRPACQPGHGRVQHAGGARGAAGPAWPARRRTGRAADGHAGGGARQPADHRPRRRRAGGARPGASRPERSRAGPGRRLAAAAGAGAGCGRTGAGRARPGCLGPSRAGVSRLGPSRAGAGRAEVSHVRPSHARDCQPRPDRRTAMSTAMGRLVRTELKLMTRDPLVLTFVFAFPIVTMLIIGGAFGTDPDPAFDGTNPSHWYVASYLTVVIAATGLVMLPVHLASYRERGVLRRFAAAGFPRWSFAIAQLTVGLLTTAVACALLLAVAAPVYGIPAVHDAWRVAVALPLGAVAFVSIGVLLGSVLPSARAAQAVGLLLFFPSFLLGAGGPPPHVMGSIVKQVAGPLPLTLLTNAVRAPWLGL